eukprot:8185176-Karenia_brevis.AAC.1
MVFPKASRHRLWNRNKECRQCMAFRGRGPHCACHRSRVESFKQAFATSQSHRRVMEAHGRLCQGTTVCSPGL